MDVGKLASGELFDFECINDKGETGIIKLRLLPFSIKRGTKFRATNDEKLTDAMIEEIGAVITEWDLTDAGQPVPCDKAHKDQLLPNLFGMRLKVAEVEDGKEEKAKFLGARIMQIADNAANFLKN